MIALAIAFFAATAGDALPTLDWKQICAGGGAKDAYACAYHELAGAERRLARTYKNTLVMVPDSDEWDNRKTKAQLIMAQKAWLAFRDANCDFQGGQEGGASNWVDVMSTDCKIDETKKRIDYLQHYFTALSSR